MNEKQNTEQPDKPYLSFSRLNMFLRCPRQFEYRYMKGIKTPPSGALFLGSRWHETLELNYRQKIDSDEDLPLGDMQEYFAEQFDQGLKKEEIVYNPGENAGKLKDVGVAVVEEHHKVIAPTVKPKIVEERIQVSLGEEFPHELLLIPDVIERDGTIVDNKSYGQTPSQEKVDKDLQLTVYALGYRIAKKEIEPGLRIDCVVKNKAPKAVQRKTTRTNKQCRWVLTMIEQLAAAIETGVFYPNPTGNLCSPKWCGYWDKCRG